MRIAVKPQPQGGAVSWFRGTGPAYYLATMGHQPVVLHSGALTPDQQREIVRTADVVHTVAPAGDHAKAPSEWHERRGILSVDLDDDIWVWLDDPAHAIAEEAQMTVGPVASGKSHAVSKERIAELETWLQAADVVTTTTEALARTIASHVDGAKVHVIPNAIPPEAQKGRMTEMREKRQDSRVLKQAGLVERALAEKRVVAWTGSVAHIPDLTPALEALARVRSVDPQLVVRSLGPVDFMQSSGFKRQFQGTTDYAPVMHRDERTQQLVPQVPFDFYFDALEAMAPDVAVIPMRDSPFNRGKSAVTLYAWAAQGVPCVVSRTGPYAVEAEMRFPALYVPHDDVDAWVNALRSLLYEPAARRELGERAHAWVMKHHAFPDAAYRWEIAWLKAITRKQALEQAAT